MLQKIFDRCVSIHDILEAGFKKFTFQVLKPHLFYQNINQNLKKYYYLAELSGQCVQSTTVPVRACHARARTERSQSSNYPMRFYKKVSFSGLPIIFISQLSTQALKFKRSLHARTDTGTCTHAHEGNFACPTTLKIRFVY